MSKIVCGVRGGVGPVCPKTFVHEFYWCCLGRGGGTMDIVLLFCRRVSNLCESMPAGTLSLGPGYSHIAY